MIFQEFLDKWNTIYKLREDAQKALEIKRADKFIGASLEAKITIHCTGELYNQISSHKDEFAAIFIVSAVEVADNNDGEFKGEYEGVSFTVKKADGQKCERCWIYSTELGTDAEHPTLCPRCAAVIKGMEA